MPTMILEGPPSDPSMTGATDPFTPPPSTKLALRPQAVVVPQPAPVRTRRRGRAFALLALFAVAGAATGGALAYFGIEPSNDPAARLPTARAALGAIRGFGDYTTAPRYDTVAVPMETEESFGGGLCNLIGLCDEEDSAEFTVSASGWIDATVPLGEVARRDVVLSGGRRTVAVYLTGAEVGAPVVDRSSMSAVDGDGDPYTDGYDEDEVEAYAEDEIESHAYDAGLAKDAQRAARRLLVQRLHALGFKHVRISFA